jgi:hypothetical protein
VDLLAQPDGGVGAVPPTAQLRLEFTQLLDGDKIETVLDGSAVKGMTDVASLVWTDAPAGAPTITAVSTYSPSGGVIEMATPKPRPSVFIQPDPGLPSGAKLKLTLQRAKITSKKGTPFTGPDQQTFETAPLSAETSVKDGDTISADTPITVTFNNGTPDTIGSAITLSAGGSPVAIELKKDEMNPLVVLVMPKDGPLPLRADYALGVAKDAADLFGVKLPEAVMVKFAVAQVAGDGGAPPSDGPAMPEGGAADGAGADGGSILDGGATADAAAEGGAAPDGGADAVADGSSADGG